MIKIEIKEQYMKDAQPALKYFTDLSSRVGEEEFKTMVYRRHKIRYSELNEQTKEKIDSIIKEGYGDYLRMCELVKDGLYYSEGFEDSQNPKSVGCKILQNGDKVLHIRLCPPLKEREYGTPYFESLYFPGQGNLNCILSNNTQLMLGISNTGIKDIYNSIKQTKNINNYNLTYGDNPTLLAISKGWNHISNKCENVADHLKAKLQDFHNLKSTRDLTEEEIDSLNKMEGSLNTYEKKKLNEPSIKQKDIIDTLLKRGDLDINCIYLPSGMTPLHIACMRGDSPELIQKLLDKGAKPNAVDYQGNEPIDLCSWKYDEVQKFLECMTQWKFGKNDFGNPIYSENRSATVTLPTQEERDKNIKGIREILSKSIVREDPVERLDATVNPFAPINDNSEPSTSLLRRMEYLQIEPLELQSTLKR